MSRITKIAMASLFAGAVTLMSGCNMFRGLGEDISGAAVTTQETFFGPGGAAARSSDRGGYYYNQ